VLIRAALNLAVHSTVTSVHAAERTAMLLFSLVVAASAQSAPQRNVLHIVADDLRTSLGLYGHAEIHTPHLDALAAKATVFENAYCQQPICSPSRNSFMTGLTPNHTKAYK